MPVKFRDDWDTLARINWLQRMIIVLSIAYYEFDESLVSDYKYDNWVRQLKQLMDECPNKEQSRYWYAYTGWTGATGCELYYKLNDADRQRLTEHAAFDIKTMNTIWRGE